MTSPPPDDVAAFIKAFPAAFALAYPDLAAFIAGERHVGLTRDRALEIAEKEASECEARLKARLAPLRQLLRSIEESIVCARAAAAAVTATPVTYRVEPGAAVPDAYRGISTVDATKDAVENIVETLTNGLANEIDAVRFELTAHLVPDDAKHHRAKPVARFIVWLLRHAVEADEERIEPAQIKKFLEAHLPSQTLSWEAIRKI